MPPTKRELPAVARHDPHDDARLSALLFLVTALWGLNMVALKAIASHYEPAVMAVERSAIATLCMLALLWRRRGRVTQPRSSKRQYATVLLCALLMVYLNQTLLAGGLKRTTATNASIAIALSPLVSSLLVALMLRERIGMRRAIGVLLGFGGVVFVVLKTRGANLGAASLGDAMVVASVVTFAAGSVFLQRLARDTDSLYASAMIFGAGTLMLLVHTAFLDTAGSVESWAPGVWPVVLVLFSSLIATAFGNLAWNYAIVKIGVARVSIWFYWVPLFGVGFSAALLGEALSPWHGVGLLAVIGGTILGTRRS